MVINWGRTADCINRQWNVRWGIMKELISSPQILIIHSLHLSPCSSFFNLLTSSISNSCPLVTSNYRIPSLELQHRNLWWWPASTVLELSMFLVQFFKSPISHYGVLGWRTTSESTSLQSAGFSNGGFDKRVAVPDLGDEAASDQSNQRQGGTIYVQQLETHPRKSYNH